MATARLDQPEEPQSTGVRELGAQQPAAGLKVGAKLRQARKVRRLKLKELADRIGASESLISKIENERVIPSLQTLHKLVSELGISIGALFSGDVPSQIVFRQGTRPILNVDSTGRLHGKGIRIESLALNHELLYPSIHIVAPGGETGGAITHEGEEVGYVLQGRLRITIDGKEYLLEQGDSFLFRSELPHGYRNDGDIEAKILWVNTPSTF
jgi:transcriptional regulator with XRE-family HTH domain